LAFEDNKLSKIKRKYLSDLNNHRINVIIGLLTMIRRNQTEDMTDEQ